jgi:hypothetical protein
MRADEILKRLKGMSSPEGVKWVASDALRELTSAAVRRRIRCR